MTDEPFGPGTGVDDDSWKTPELREAEAHLAEVEVQSDELLERAQAMPIPPSGDPASRERVEALKSAAEAHDAPAELRVLKRKVGEGALSWEDVLKGKAYDDPDVRAAMAGKLDELRGMYTEFEEGHTLEEVIEARGGDPLNPPPPPASAEEPPRDDLDDEDDGPYYFR